MVDSYDFQVDSLKFRMAASDQFPYARGTAQFRKEQFDSAATVGDQSLSGWWTRGQLSFHGGTGIKYYEVLDGEGVLDRFQDSHQVAPFETPGQVRLDYGWDAYFTPTSAVLDASTASDTKYYIDLTSGTEFEDYGTLKKLSGPWPPATHSTVTLTGGATARYLCDDGKTRVFVCTNLTIERMTSGGAAEYIYSTDGANNFRGLWYAKDRLWALTASGKLFALSPDKATPATAIPLSTPTCTLTEAGSRRATLTASGSAIYFANDGSRVYRVGLATDGSVPALAAPVVAAELPAYETIYNLFYYLGYVVMVTTQGVRVAQEQGDGSLVYGPILVYSASKATRKVSAAETSVLVPLMDTSGTKGAVWEINLSTPVGENPLEFARQRRHDITGATGSGTLGCVDTGLPYAPMFWLSDKVDVQGRGGILMASTGFLLTGYHRFGTLEPKHFQSVSVRCSGSGGSIDVYRVDADGAATLLGNITTAEGAKDFSLGLTAPVERVALKFVFNRGPWPDYYTPFLLGYQLRALPSPKRQRIIKWPVAIADTIRDRAGVERGRRGDAWVNWSELETLEETDALVTYTDLRTGETGQAYIESLELQTDTPSKGHVTGFGGIGYITLRRVGT